MKAPVCAWLLCGALSTLAQDQPAPWASNDWLAAGLRLPDLVLLHAGTQKDYDAGHIPGARLITSADISVTGPGELRLELPPISALESTLSRLGITNKSIVVVYAGNDIMPLATRVWFTLDYLGVRVSLLNGPLKVWREEGRPVTTEPAIPEPARFTAAPQSQRVIDAAGLKAQLDANAITLIDARAPEFYSGSSLGVATRPGHIPGARNVPFTSLLDEKGRLKSLPDLRSALGAEPGRPLAAYCHIGLQATLVYYAARVLGLDVRLYDGSFQDWSARPELPVEK